MPAKISPQKRAEILAHASDVLADRDVSEGNKEKIRTQLAALGIDVADFEAGAKQVAKAFDRKPAPRLDRRGMDRDLRALRGDR